MSKSPFLQLSLTAAAIVLALGGCASNESKQQGATEQEVYQVAQTQINRNNWTGAVQALELLEENFPFGTYGEQAQLELIYSHYRARDYAAAIAVADRFIRLHPQHRNVDYAYYLRGLASFSSESSFLGSLLGSDNTNRDPGGARASFDHFAQFVQRFPNSPYAADAQKRMIYLRNVLARGEIHVANYYFTRGAYLAALNRGQFVLQNYPNTPAIPDALAVVAQAYYLLGDITAGDNHARLLAVNYPDHPALNSAGEFDQKFVAGERQRSLLSRVTFGLFDRREARGFDTRELYNDEYRAASAPPPG